MNTNETEDYIRIASHIRRAFDTYSVVLYIGTDADIDNIPDEIIMLPFSCVITTCKFGSLDAKFKIEHRQTIDYWCKKDLIERYTGILNRREMPIIYLNGNEEFEDELFDPKDNALEILNYVVEKLDFGSLLIIAGYSDSKAEEMPAKTLCRQLLNLKGINIEFFHCNDLSDIWNKLPNISHHKVSFFDIFKDYSDDSDDNDFDIITEENTRKFYYGGKIYNVPEIEVREFDNYGQLLTMTVNRIHPYGKDDRLAWYTRFVNESYKTPQWYGYISNVGFYVERSFEKPLLALVKQLLKNDHPSKFSNDRPVILQGDPCSSKSIELAAVAYKIFNEKEHPVIFINKEELFLSKDNDEFERLDSLMCSLEHTGDMNKNILLIWDCSAYHNVMHKANILMEDLKNRGRKFVLVCSAYSNSIAQNSALNNQTKYCLKDNIFKEYRDGDSNPDVIFDGKHYIIRTSRYMSEREFHKTEQLTQEFADNSLPIMAKIKEFRSKEKPEHRNMFFFYYQMYRVLQPHLRSSLKKEQRTVITCVRKKLDKLVEYEEPYESPMAQIFRELGFEVPADVRKSTDEEMTASDKKLESNIDRFCDAVALFSQFKLALPAAYAFTLLGINENSYWNNCSELLNIMSELPYIVYSCPEGKEYEFSFRLPLEAEIYLHKNYVSPEKQIGIVCDILDWYSKRCLSKYYDEDMSNKIQVLLRLMGPNTDYGPFKNGGERAEEHQKILAKYDAIIEKLRVMREERGFEDLDGSFIYNEVTYTREFYGTLYARWNDGNANESDETKLWENDPASFTDETYVMRINKLEKAIELSQDTISDLEERYRNATSKKDGFAVHLLSNRNGLIVEMCQCSTHLENVWRTYDAYCKYKGIQNIKKKPRKLSYITQYNCLLKVIRQDPTNGFPYNQLFKTFIKLYDNNEFFNENDKARNLLNIISICDSCSGYEMVNIGQDGHDTLGDNIMKISSYMANYNATIDAIEHRRTDNRLLVLFDQFIENGKATGVCFVCQTELKNMELDTNSIRKWQSNHPSEVKVLTDEQRKKCREIIAFMEKYADCVNKSEEALYLMLRVYWMGENGAVLDSNEHKMTYIDRLEKWQYVFNLCQNYKELHDECNCDVAMPPTVIMLQSLAAFQLGGFKKASEVLRELKERMFIQVKRMRTPYIICDEDGKPKRFTGVVTEICSNGKGKVKINGFGNETFDFFANNLKPSNRISINAHLQDLILGMGYMRISVRGMGDVIGGREI